MSDTLASPGRGFYVEPLQVVITSQTAGATIVYTTDGSLPSPDNGFQVAVLDPLTPPQVTLPIATTSVLRVAGLKEDHLASPVQTYSYIFAADVASQDIAATLAAGFPDMWRSTTPDYGMDTDVVGPNDLFAGVYADQFVDSLQAVPTLSLVMDVDDLFGELGIYANPTKEGREWERPTSVELIWPDGSTDLQIDAGIRMAGGMAREHANTKKKTFRLVFRSEFGPTKLEFPLFGPDAADRFDTIILRNGYNDGWQWSDAGAQAQYLRDQWLVRDAAVHGSTWIARHVHAPVSEWLLLGFVQSRGASRGLVVGNLRGWQQGRVGCAQHRQRGQRVGPGVAGVAAAGPRDGHPRSNSQQRRRLSVCWATIQMGLRNPEYEVLLDVENMIDYLIANFYAGNTDWPRRNWYVVRERGPESTGFKFYCWDGEWTLNLRSDLHTDRTGVADSVAQIYGFLRNNDEFRLWFADRVHKHFFNGGPLYVDPQHPESDPDQPQRNVPAALYSRLADTIERALIAESARWGDQHREPPYTIADWRAEQDDLLANYFPQRSAIVLDQLAAAGLYPRLAAPQLSQYGGTIAAGFQLDVTAPGDVYYTLDGSDPRRGAGSRFPGAGDLGRRRAYTGPIRLPGTMTVKARTYVDGQWSADRGGLFCRDVASEGSGDHVPSSPG